MTQELLAQKIVAAAARLFAHHGFHRTGMRAISQAAGVSIGGIYHYFRSKEEILLAIVREEVEARLSFLEELRRQDLPVPEQIRRIVEMHFARLEENQDITQLLHHQWRDPSPLLRQKITELYEQLAASLARLIEEGIAAGQIVPCNSTVAAYALIGLVEGVTQRALAGDAVGEELLKEGPEQLTKILTRWLVPPQEKEATK
jgi:AcrR family transcriptional regulator